LPIASGPLTVTVPPLLPVIALPETVKVPVLSWKSSRSKALPCVLPLTVGEPKSSGR